MTQPLADEDIKKVFEFFDIDSSGSIDVSELKEKMQSLGFMFDLEELRAMIRDVDDNGNGTIELAEFMKLMQLEAYQGLAVRMLSISVGSLGDAEGAASADGAGDGEGAAESREPKKRKLDNAPNPDGAQSIRGLDLPVLQGRGLRIGIVSARWNSVVCGSLVAGCKEALAIAGVDAKDVVVEYVAGSYELPFAAQMLLESRQFDGIICIGCLIKGETMHFEYISEAVTQGIMKLNLSYKTPVIYGVLSVFTELQAKERAGVDGAGHNSGKDWGVTCVESCLLRRKYTASSTSTS